MLKKTKHYWIFILLLIISINASSTNYYVNASVGSNSNEGTSPSKPFKDPWILNNIEILPGDTIFFACGTSYAGHFGVAADGTEQDPIVFTHYGDGPLPVFRNPDQFFAFSIKGAYQVFDELIFRDTHHSGIDLNAPYAEIKNCEITNVGVGIAIHEAGARIHDNYIHDLHMVMNTVGGNDDYGAIGINIRADSATIYNNLIENCIDSSYDYGVDGGILEFYGDIRHIRIFNNTGKGSDGFFEVGGGTISDVQIFYNLMINNGEIGGFHFQGDFGAVVSDFNIINNTVYEDVSGEYQVIWFNGDSYAPEVNFTNNIVYYSGFSSFTGVNSFKHFNNLYFSPDNTPNGKLIPGTSEIIADPLFYNVNTGDFHIHVGSPAINAGKQMEFISDFDGNPIIDLPDMGSYENQGIPCCVNGVEIENCTDTILLYDSFSMIATVLPVDVLNDSVFWSVSDENIASVNNKGFITTFNKGRVTIKVETQEGGFQDSCIINVIKPVKGVAIENCIDTMSWNEIYDLSAIVSPADASDRSLTWYSSDKQVILIDSSGLVTALTPGMVVISAETNYGRFIDECIITVVKPVTGVEIKQCIDTLTVNDTCYLTAIVSPEDASDRSINWYSSDENIASVDTGGVISAISAGEATIEVMTTDGGITDECKINVIVPLGVKNSMSGNTSIYPNPADTFIRINTNHTDIQWSLFSMYGRKVSEGTKNLIDIQQLKPGIYVLNLAGEANELIVW